MIKYILLVIAVILSVSYISVRVKKGGIGALLLKIFASLFFVFLALYASYVDGLSCIALLIVLGLIFGLIGDVFLELNVLYLQHENIYQNARITSFSFGNIMYILATIFYANNIFVSNNTALFLCLIGLGFAGIITTFIGFYGQPLLNFNFGSNKILILFKTFIMSFITAFAVAVAVFNPIFISFAIGIVLLFVSEFVLSLQNYCNKQNNKILTIISYATYYLAQISIAFSIFLI